MPKINPKSQIVADTVVDILSEKDERSILGEVAANLFEIGKKEEKQNKLEVTSSIKLSKEEKNKILKYFKNLFKRELIFNNIIDPSVIGGLKIECGDFLLDMTLKKRIEALSEII